MCKDEILELLRGWHNIKQRSTSVHFRHAVHGCIADLKLLAESNEIFITDEEITEDQSSPNDHIGI